MSLSVKTTPPYYKHWFSSFEKTYDKTPENIFKISTKVAKLYAFFLTPQAHDTRGTFWNKVKESIWLHPSPLLCPNQEVLSAFEQTLQRKIETALKSEKRWSVNRLSVDYAPDPGVLLDALEESMSLETFYNCEQLFPYKSLTRIAVCDDKIILDLILHR